MSTRIELSEFQNAYLTELDELLSAANTHLLAIEATPDREQPRAVRELFRALHTVKGLSAMVGIEPIVEIAHRMETALRTADRAGGRLAPGAVDQLLEGVRAIGQRASALASGSAILPPPATLLDALDALEAPEAKAPTRAHVALDPALAARLSPFELDQLARAGESGRRAVRADFVPSPGRAAAGMTINTVRERVAKVAEIVKVVPLSLPRSESAPGGLAFALLLLTRVTDDVLAEAMDVAPDTLQTLGGNAAPPIVADVLDEVPGDADEPRRQGIVRVDVARLDDAMERLSAMIVTRFQLERAAAALPLERSARRQLDLALAEHARQLRDLRASIVRVRMVPLLDVLDRVPLLVRGLARSTGKRVQLDMTSARGELDKGVAERVFQPLVHLIRNAVDHAIEAPEERVKLGKPAVGQLRISCSEAANGRLEICVEDDGRGIDAAAVARRANAPVPATAAGLLDLLCAPGFSTRDTVTETSGRGMGMDIVRRVVVNELGGEIVLATKPGLGTVFTLRVPLTISIVDAFAFECSSQRFVVPVAAVDEIVEIDPMRVTHGPSPRHGDHGIALIERRGVAMPLVALDRLFRLAAPSSNTRKALVVRHREESMAFAVDRMLGQQEIVVRPLEDPLLKAPGIAGATDLGDGRPTLVLDLSALGDLVAGTRRKRSVA